MHFIVARYSWSNLSLESTALDRSAILPIDELVLELVIYEGNQSFFEQSISSVFMHQVSTLFICIQT